MSTKNFIKFIIPNRAIAQLPEKKFSWAWLFINAVFYIVGLFIFYNLTFFTYFFEAFSWRSLSYLFVILLVYLQSDLPVALFVILVATGISWLIAKIFKLPLTYLKLINISLYCLAFYNFIYLIIDIIIHWQISFPGISILAKEFIFLPLYLAGFSLLLYVYAVIISTKKIVSKI